MPARLLILVFAALLAVVPAACGGGGDEDDVNTILEETFTGDKEVDSGRLALSLRVDAQGSEQLEGPVALTLAGPFRRQGEEALPLFDLDATVSGAGMRYQAGAISTGDAGFLRFQDQYYALSDEVFEQFTRGFLDAREEKSEGDDPGVDLATLGIDPRKWLTNARNAGEATVGDAGTIRITGDVDVPELLDDLAQAGERARALDGEDRADLPEELTEEQRREIVEAVEGMTVEIFTGEEDRTLRRIVLDADVRAPEGSEDFETADVRLAYEITRLNEDLEEDEIQAPENPRPFEELERQLQGFGIGGAAGRGGPDQAELRRYTRCVERADDDRAAVQECSDLL